MQTHWMADTAPHKRGGYQDKCRFDIYTQSSLDFRYLPQTNIPYEAVIDKVKQDLTLHANIILMADKHNTLFYADDITITFTHTSTSAAKKYIPIGT